MQQPFLRYRLPLLGFGREGLVRHMTNVWRRMMGAAVGLALGGPIGALVGAATARLADEEPAPQPAHAPRRGSAADPYAVLGVARVADAGTIKAAYRRRLNEHHPDRLAGAEPEALARATHETRAITEAYRRICRERGWR